MIRDNCVAYALYKLQLDVKFDVPKLAAIVSTSVKLSDSFNTVMISFPKIHEIHKSLNSIKYELLVYLEIRLKVKFDLAHQKYLYLDHQMCCWTKALLIYRQLIANVHVMLLQLLDYFFVIFL